MFTVAKSFLIESRGELASANSFMNSRKLDTADSGSPTSTEKKLESESLLRVSGLRAVVEAYEIPVVVSAGSRPGPIVRLPAMFGPLGRGGKFVENNDDVNGAR